jgi:hypothetical protein
MAWLWLFQPMGQAKAIFRPSPLAWLGLALGLELGQAHHYAPPWIVCRWEVTRTWLVGCAGACLHLGTEMLS